MSGLYIHIPFCRKKCAYCDFVSFGGCEQDAFEQYFKALFREIDLISPMLPKKEFETVFIGGGTPSLLPSGMIPRLAAKLRENFAFPADAEISIECNPESVSLEKLVQYRACGINRISFGLQSADDAVLKAVGRIHTAADFFRAFKLARQAGFDNINVDIMHGLPGQSSESYLDTIRRTAELGAEHISSYALILAEGTPLFETVRNGSIELPDEDAVADMEDAGFDLLRSFGYERYEISNFALPGRECRHNLNYWANGDYLGLGLNAHSALHVNGKWVRFANKAELGGYNAALNDGKLPVEMTEEISRGDEMFECIMVGLRKIKGIDRAEFAQRFGIDPVEHYASAVSDAVLAGNMEVTDDSMRLTQRGLDFQNEVLLNFM